MGPARLQTAAGSLRPPRGEQRACVVGVSRRHRPIARHARGPRARCRRLFMLATRATREGTAIWTETLCRMCRTMGLCLRASPQAQAHRQGCSRDRLAVALGLKTPSHRPCANRGDRGAGSSAPADAPAQQKSSRYRGCRGDPEPAMGQPRRVHRDGRRAPGRARRVPRAAWSRGSPFGRGQTRGSCYRPGLAAKRASSLFIETLSRERARVFASTALWWYSSAT